MTVLRTWRCRSPSCYNSPNSKQNHRVSLQQKCRQNFRLKSQKSIPLCCLQVDETKVTNKAVVGFTDSRLMFPQYEHVHASWGYPRTLYPRCGRCDMCFLHFKLIKAVMFRSVGEIFGTQTCKKPFLPGILDFYWRSSFYPRIVTCFISRLTLFKRCHTATCGKLPTGREFGDTILHSNAHRII